VRAALAQAELASAVKLSRTTLNQLENGVFPDIGVKKLLALLHHLGKDMSVIKASTQTHPNFVRIARTIANVSYKETLTDEELIHSLLTGKVLRTKRPNFRALLEEAPVLVIAGLIKEVGEWNNKTEKVKRNLEKIAHQLGVERSHEPWSRTG
jgi:DNA-binding XRE family transcriptional regulator